MHKHALLVSLIGILVATSSVLALDGREILALDSIYHSYPAVMTGFGWTTDFGAACNETSSWNRTIGCDDDHITSITLVPSLGLAQTKFALTDAWSDLTYLEEISIVGLNITGTVPTSFNLLANLSVLALPLNELTGFIPDLSQTNLSAIDLSGNTLIGTIPSYLFSMPYMSDIRLAGNWLHGPIPDENWSPYLETIMLRDNVLNGSIPSMAAIAPALETLIIDTNRLSGTIPYALFASPIRSFSIFSNMLDICSGRLIPQPTRIIACAILPQFFDQQQCNCTQKWNDQCGDLPESCPECQQPAPTSDFKCSTTEAGWWIENFHLKAGQEADFSATSSNSPAIVLGSFIAEPGSRLLFNFNSAIQTRSTMRLFGEVDITLTEADTVYLGNQISGDLYQKSWLPVTRNYITSYSNAPQTVSEWSPDIDVPQVCHFLTASSTSRPIPNPFKNLNIYSVTYQYQAAVRFRCSPWVIVIGVFSGALFLGLALFLSCYIYTKVQIRKRERIPLLQ